MIKKIANIFKIFLLFTLYSLRPTPGLTAADLGIDVGNKSIDFSLKEVSSADTFKLSNYNSKNPVLISFFATWCPYCVQEIPNLNKIQNEYGKKGLIVVGVDIQEKEEKIADFAKKKKILYKILLDIKSEASQQFKVYGIPTSILIDSKGIIVFRGNSLPDEKDIEKVLVKKKKK